MTAGISIKLCRYLYFSTVIVPVAGSAANPEERSNEITKNRKKKRKGTVFNNNFLTEPANRDLHR